jgi:hypothetical protein
LVLIASPYQDIQEHPEKECLHSSIIFTQQVFDFHQIFASHFDLCSPELATKHLQRRAAILEQTPWLT